MVVFTIIGMIVASIVALLLAALIVLLVWNFFAYQIGARNARKYLYTGPKRNELWWTWYGAKVWASSFVYGGGWSRTVADPEDDNYDLKIYDNGKIVRMPTRYPG